MTFDEVLAQVLELLQREGRVSYRALKRRFGLDEAYLEDLKEEIIAAKQLAIDEGGSVLVWTGTPAPPPVREREPAPLAFTPSYLTEKILTSRTALEGERKQITVLFADIQGSTELIAGLDPEEARQILDPVLHLMMDAVHRYEGTVNQVLGDGIMALFGAPLAHEDHAIRACYAALAMQQAMHHYTEEVRRSHGIAVRVRLGLNSGEVVVRAIGNDLHMDYSAIGQTTHLAARMEQLAAPGSILLTAATLRLVEGLVQVTALGPVPVKGLAAPVEVCELIGASPIRRRLQATAARGLTRFVGRRHELDTLHQAQEKAGAGQGQVVVVRGEPGVGKSRLLYECIHSHRTRGWLVLESAAVSYGQATAYAPVIEVLKRYFTIEDREETRTIRAKVTGQVLTLDETLHDTIPVLLSLLEALPEPSPFHALDPPQRRQRTLEVLKRLLHRESRVQPLLLVFEDMQWADSETQALLDSLVEGLDGVRLLLLINCRPEYQHGWGRKPRCTELRLAPLPPERAEELLQALLGDAPGLAALKHLLIERTEGNPFFLEECVRTLVEAQELVGEWGSYHLAQALPTIQVPATVQAVLAARIDRLPATEKRLLQVAAVIGTDVPLPLLRAIAELPEATLHRSLTHLQAAEFLHQMRLFPELAYTFTHTLTHEVAYGSLLQERRRPLHERIVEALETLAGERLAEQVEWLAHHALRGEVWHKAVPYFRQAGTKAIARSAYREAVLCFEQALGALQHLPEGRETRQQAIDLHFDLRNALAPLGEFGRILDTLREAESLAEALDDQSRLGQVSAYMSTHFFVMGDHDQAIAAGERALAMATASGDFGLQIVTNAYLGFAYHALGDYHWAMDFLRRNVAALEGELVRERFGQVGLVSVLSRTWLVWCLAEVGAFTEGTASGEEGMRIAKAVEHPFSLIAAYGGIGRLYLIKGDLPQAIPMLERGLALCQAIDTPVLFPLTASTLGAAYALCGRLAEALPLLEQAVQQASAMGMMFGQALWVVWLSAGYLLAGRRAEARAHAERALEIARAHQERGYQAYALRLLGDIAMQSHPPQVERAEAYYREALTLAEERGMRPLQAHCHGGLGTLYAKISRSEQARAALSAAIALYRAMDLTFWLPQGEAALAQVEGH